MLSCGGLFGEDHKQCSTMGCLQSWGWSIWVNQYVYWMAERGGKKTRIEKRLVFAGNVCLSAGDDESVKV